MNTSFRHSRDKLLAGFLDFLWFQWASVGVAGHGAPGAGRMIDPEALLLATSRVARHDPRLLDGVLDWLNVNGSRINLQRLQRLQEMWPLGDMRVIGAVASIVSRQSVMRKWAPLSSPAAGAIPQPFFIGAGGEALPLFSEPDPHFLRHGLVRDPVEMPGTSKSPDPYRVSNLIFILRALFGVNARAEIVAWLLTHESGHPARIARDTGYFSKSIQHTLNEMEDSGHIRSRREGREKVFSIRSDDWKFLITWQRPAAFPFWTEWMPLFSGIAAFIDGLDDPQLDTAPEPVRAILLRESLSDAMASLYQTDFAGSLTAREEQTGTLLIEAVLADAEMLSHHLTWMADHAPSSGEGSSGD
ncbi:MAG: hypothetical protein EOP87_20380 [Verrucomicrobiaceae bacterium]|nr:MAG: hypothetical protein EOP87_20380 [Verrucomicrobiaceae bacterium]